MGRDQRSGSTQGIAGFIGAERRRLFDDASPERRARLEAGARRGRVISAWNAVCAGSREGAHVTGLHYVPDGNELVVYMDAPSWTQEMTMLREIIRARMAAHGAEVDGIVFKTSRIDPEAPARAARPRPAAAKRPPAPRAPLTPQEELALSEEVSPIPDAHLREALRAAMHANLEWQKGKKDVDSAKRP